ncbi:MAG: ABC transporter substrate-binding protein [Candidatus Tectomicrobia bacterium]|nr:ABC transporter substrate-binding protein [Candidatus Tectomicrobia bacterium]
MRGARGLFAVICAVVFGVVSLGGAPRPAAAQGKGPVKVGVLLTLTTTMAFYGQRQLEAIKMAVEEAEAAGGINGRKIELVVEDSARSNTTAVNGLNKILRSDPVVVLGSILGTQNMAVLPLINRAKVPILVVSGTRKITQQGSPWMFRFTNHDGIGKAAWTKFVVENLKKKSVCILLVANEWGYSGRDETIQVLQRDYKMKPLMTETYQATDKDMSAQLLKMRDANCDIIMTQGHPADEALIAKQMRQLNIHTDRIGSGSFSISATLKITEPEDVKGRYAEVPAEPPDSATNPKIRSFAEGFKKKYGHYPDVYSMLEYDLAKTLIEVMRKYGTSAEQIRRGLRKIKYEGIASVYEADKEGNMHHGATIVRYGDNKQAIPQATITVPFER